ncbi:type II CAAX prenyl endopeptidase Rce1 family protein [Parasphingorhabdus sp.]|uniref:CPBP family glutamic-type intramembrane protease n=1 Tax=Parasphingorhabdus sp. TaxID=2709688 RepID=UPI003A92D954
MFEANSTIGWAIGRLSVTAADLLAFLRAPKLDGTASPAHRQTTGLSWLFALNLIIVAAIAAVLVPIMLALDISMSTNMSDLLNRPVWQLLLLVVVVGPIFEELIFRSWLGGSPRLLVPFFAFVAWTAGTFIAGKMGWMHGNSIVPLVLLAGVMIAAVVGLAAFWKRPVPQWFVRFFPLIFWSQALLFAFVHVFNYAGDNPATMLPFVLPQLVGGLIWGYARIHHGWWANIAMHMAYNLIATSGLLYMALTQAAGL